MDIISLAGLNQPDAVKQAVDFYTEMIKSMNEVKKLKESGQDSGHEQIRFFKLEAKTNAIFKELDNYQQLRAVEILVDRGLMAEKILITIKVFGGRITKV